MPSAGKHIVRLGLLFVTAVIFVGVGALTHGPWATMKAVVLMFTTWVMWAGLRALLNDSLDAALVTLCLVMVASFLPQPAMGLSLVFAIGVAMGGLLRGNEFQPKFSVGGAETPQWDGVAWLIWFSMVPLLGFMANGKFITHDIFHPLYELSIGHSYGLSMLHPPDLSYAGKGIRFHFLTTRLPVLFSELLDASLLEGVYFLAPAFLAVMAAVILTAFFKRHKDIRIPILVVFFCPWNGGPLNLVVNFTNVTQQFDTSYYVGMLVLIIASHYLITGEKTKLYVTGALLILVKASFFLILLGGIFLFYVRDRRYWEALVMTGALSVTLAALYALFLSGAHLHNHWMIFPNYIYRVLHDGRSAMTSLDWLQVISFAVFAPVWAVTVFLSFFSKAPWSTAMMAVSAVALSGLLGFTFLTEVTERNAEQFMRGSAFFGAVVVWNWWSAYTAELRPLFRRALTALMMAVVFVSAVRTLVWAPGYAIFTAMTPQAAARPFRTVITEDMARAYTKLGALPEGVTLFAKHYETPILKKSDNHPVTAFVRSAMSGRQMYNEEFMQKAVGMEPDYPQRFANVEYFYETMVIPSVQSRQYMKRPTFLEIDKRKEKARPFSAQSGLEAKGLRFFGLGKEWSWVNREYFVDFAIEDELAALRKTGDPQEWARTFLRKNRIRYIVLEHGDKPSPTLKAMTQPVVEQGSVTVLKLR